MIYRFSLYVFVILLLTVSIASSYTVILKNGKRIEGAYLEENENAILIQDQDGVTLTFRKKTLDLDAMKETNSPQRHKEKAESESTNESAQTQPVDRKPKKVFTNEDLKDLPEISILGSEHPPEENSEEQHLEQAPDTYSNEKEMYWKERTMELANHLYEAEDVYLRLQQECDAAKEAFSFYVLNGYWGGGWAPVTDPAYVCDQANQAKAAYERWLVRLEEFQERARKEGALPGWIDPERL